MTPYEELKEHFKKYKWEVKRKASGKIKYDYLVPAGPYDEHWDWDGFFIGMALSSQIPSEAIYLKNWTRNYLENVKKDGFTPGLLTPEGVDTRLKHIKPFFAQAAYHASKNLGDFSWLKNGLGKIEKATEYRQKKYYDSQTGLSCWADSMESGADNNIAALDYPDGSVIAVDLNAFLYLELRALSKIAGELGKKPTATKYSKKAQTLKKQINSVLWSTKDESYYNIDRKTGAFITRDTYSNFIPLFAGIAPKNKAEALITKYLINPKKMWAKHGIRTLAKDDPGYSQRNIIKPHSNWQGPVWPIANYLYFQGLLQYGFTKEATELSKKIISICLKDIKTSGGMHEDYNAETGAPLAAPNFVSWNLLVELMPVNSKEKHNPFLV
ncbi:hypothetical protein KKH43_02750 [Patescibacteria group bacterium]|nr:hypothetical protein [Patescibacteria group bacterium]